MLQSIVVPLDGSALSWQAVPTAARIARATGSVLHLVRVAVLPLESVWQGMNPALHLAQMEHDTAMQASIYLDKAAESEILHGLPVTTHVLRGQPALAILEMAEQQQATLLVLSSHGETGPTRWLQGSVALQIAHLSPIPVLILQPEVLEPNPPLTERTHPIRVLVPLDGSLMAEEALTPAIALTRALSAPAPGALHLTSVLPFSRPDDHESLIQTVQDYLVSVEQSIRKSEDGENLELTSSLLLNLDIASALIALAETGKGMEHCNGCDRCDLIAMATHGQGSVQRWAMGSITERVLTTTRLPLLLVRAMLKEP